MTEEREGNANQRELKPKGKEEKVQENRKKQNTEREEQ